MFMRRFTWSIDRQELKEYYHNYMDRPSIEAIRKYYRGNKRMPMFADELKDLEMVYRSTLKDNEETIRRLLPAFLAVMEDYLSLHQEGEAVREKLDSLLAKKGDDE